MAPPQVRAPLPGRKRGSLHVVPQNKHGTSWPRLSDGDAQSSRLDADIVQNTRAPVTAEGVNQGPTRLARSGGPDSRAATSGRSRATSAGRQDGSRTPGSIPKVVGYRAKLRHGRAVVEAVPCPGVARAQGTADHLTCSQAPRPSCPAGDTLPRRHSGPWLNFRARSLGPQRQCRQLRRSSLLKALMR